MDTARVIRVARHQAGLTQAELAGLSGTSQATLSAYEHGSKTPTADTLARVLAATGVRLTTVRATAPVRVPSRDELDHRARVLSQVIDLAGRLPGRAAQPLRYPRLPHAAVTGS